MKLAQEVVKEEVTLSKWYEEFTSVFSEEAALQLPPSWSSDHTINLDETFRKIFPLSANEQEATEIFIKENLVSGKIRPSNSPQASSFFYVGKKNSSLQPCHNYRHLTEHTIKDS